VVEKDSQRAKYLSPEEAVEYGIIDRVLYPEELRREVSTVHLSYFWCYLLKNLLSFQQCGLVYQSNKLFLSSPARPPNSWTSCSSCHRTTEADVCVETAILV